MTFWRLLMYANALLPPATCLGILLVLAGDNAHTRADPDPA